MRKPKKRARQAMLGVARGIKPHAAGKLLEDQCHARRFEAIAIIGPNHAELTGYPRMKAPRPIARVLVLRQAYRETLDFRVRQRLVHTGRALPSQANQGLCGFNRGSTTTRGNPLHIGLATTRWFY